MVKEAAPPLAVSSPLSRPASVRPKARTASAICAATQRRQRRFHIGLVLLAPHAMDAEHLIRPDQPVLRHGELPMPGMAGLPRHAEPPPRNPRALLRPPCPIEQAAIDDL